MQKFVKKEISFVLWPISLEQFLVQKKSTIKEETSLGEKYFQIFTMKEVKK